ncbi:ABC transporter ATP-binding protein [Spiroplasma endosymbiont of Aspidapion aeneum]|uniref:ABC transporter ATP-binding protein n=1 Tax=Spiroplasma endosymbiont of Aspidapion aeneum TaxID=3066276 RepID=UPI00313E86F7
MGSVKFKIGKSRFLRLLFRSYLNNKGIAVAVIFLTLIVVVCYVINIKIIQWMTSIMMSKNIIDLMNQIFSSPNNEEIKHIAKIMNATETETQTLIQQIAAMGDKNRQVALQNIIHQFFFKDVYYDGIDSSNTAIVYVKILGLKMTLTLWCYFMFINVVVIVICTYLAYILSGIIAQREECKLRDKILIQLMNQDIDFFNNSKIGNLINTVVVDTEKIGNQLKIAPIIFIQVVMTTIGAISIMMSIDYQLCLITISLLTIAILIVIGIMKLTSRATNTIEDIKDDINNEVSEKLFTMKLVKSSGTWTNEKEHYRKLNKEVVKHSVKILTLKEIVTAILIGAIGSFVMSSIVFGVFLYSSQVQVLLTKMTAFTTGVLVMTLPFLQLNQIAASINEVENSVLNYEEITETDIHIDKLGGKRIVGYPKVIEFKKVSFAFPDAPTEFYIKNLNISLERGKKYAFVGKSGCGKSTIVKLLLRFYDPTFGKININYIGRPQNIDANDIAEEMGLYFKKEKKEKKKKININEYEVKSTFISKDKNENNNIDAEHVIDLKDVELAGWISRVGYVAQEPKILSGTFWDNVRYTREDISDFEIVEACKKAKIHEFILSLPQKYNTILAEQGSQLSGGQKQRLVIARMFAKDPEILLLDEATSALDSVVEKQIQKELDQLMVGRTTVAIAHRLDTIKDFDKIFVLEPKKGIVQEGTFNELIAKEGIFLNLYKHQESPLEK